MKQPVNALWSCLFILSAMIAGIVPAGAHDARFYKVRLPASSAPQENLGPPPGISGQGNLRFRVLFTSAHLPEAAQAVLVKAHGGFAVDRRPGKGETYFALPGAGILQISPDFQRIRLLPTAPEMKNVNLHGTTIWYDKNGRPFLVFPSNDAGKVFTTTLDGKLVDTLNAPTDDDVFEYPEIHDYFLGGGNFAPTGVAYLDGLYYITTGYSNLDYVLTARIIQTNPFSAMWNDLAFGGKGDGPTQFRTAHGITLVPGTKQFDISDRPHSEIKRFTRYGHYLGTLKMPSGSLPCDIDYLGHYAVVAALDGPDPSRGAPIYILEDGKLVSTIDPRDDLGLKNFKHIHNAVLRRVNNKLYIIVQAWNPGDFAILEQVTD
jgi:hypothetical protein